MSRRVGANGQALESAIQAQLAAYLRLTGWTVWEMQLGSAGGGSVYCTPGITDLYVCRPGRTVWLEVKRPGTGRVSPAQQQRHAELRAAGQEVYVVRSIEDVQAALGTKAVRA